MKHMQWIYKKYKLLQRQGQSLWKNGIWHSYSSSEIKYRVVQRKRKRTSSDYIWSEEGTLLNRSSQFICFVLFWFVLFFVLFFCFCFLFLFFRLERGNLLVSNSKFSKWPFKSLNLGKIFLFYIFKMFTLSACAFSKWLNVW